jgi:hypothetical protein
MAVALLAGCEVVMEPDAGSVDAGAMLDAGTDAGDEVCTDDLDCDDGAFCNGVERCDPEDGCVAGDPPCEGGCDELADACLPEGCAQIDADGDGVASIVCGGIDCDDDDADRHPGNPERCDAAGHDEDCDPCTVAGTAGDGDLDADGYLSIACANAFTGAAPSCGLLVRVDAALVAGIDCADMNANVHPDQVEACNLRDDDCDGERDEGVMRSFHVDNDRDGYGAMGSIPIEACGRPDGYVEDASDCDDRNRARNRAVTESCNLLDDDCDGQVDDGAFVAFFFADADDDGFGDPLAPTPGTSCLAPLGFVANFDDCDDTDVNVFPGALEVCDGRDGDCSSPFPDTGGPDAAEDGDGDGHSAMGAACTGGFPIDDCDDARALAFPGAPELCDAADNNCDGVADETPESTERCPTSFECAGNICRDAFGMALGNQHMCAIRADRTLVCWGDNALGQLGDGTTESRLTPMPVMGLSNLVEVEAGRDHTCARDAQGDVYCWGANDVGQLGDGTQEDRPTPARVQGLEAVVEVTASDRNTCALSASGRAWCWGQNSNPLSPVLGNGARGSVATVPQPVLGLTDAQEIELGPFAACALRRNGRVACWGANWNGQLGDGTNAPSPVPVEVLGVTDAVSIELGAQFGCALRASGAIFCWGFAPPLPEVTDAVELQMAESDFGEGTLCVRTTTGSITCVGNGVGDPSTITGAVRLEGNVHRFAVRNAAGEMFCWGTSAEASSEQGACGGVPGTVQLTPVQVPGIP